MSFSPWGWSGSVHVTSTQRTNTQRRTSIYRLARHNISQSKCPVGWHKKKKKNFGIYGCTLRQPRGYGNPSWSFSWDVPEEVTLRQRGTCVHTTPPFPPPPLLVSSSVIFNGVITARILYSSPPERNVSVSPWPSWEATPTRGPDPRLSPTDTNLNLLQQWGWITNEKKTHKRLSLHSRS